MALNTIEFLNKINNILPKKEKRQLSILAFLLFIGALFEAVGLGFILYFINIIIDPQFLEKQNVLFRISKTFGISSGKEFIFWAALSLIFFFVLKNLYIAFLSYIQYKFIFDGHAKLTRKLFEAYLKKPYVFYLQRNSSELQRNIQAEVGTIYAGVIQQGLILFSELMIVVCIFILLILKEPYLTLLSISILGGSSIIFFIIFQKKLSQIGKKRLSILKQLYKVPIQAFGAIKEIKLMGKESFFVNFYSKKSIQYAKIQRLFSMITQVPRLFIETIMVAGILIVVLLTIGTGERNTNTLSMLALFGMCSIRLIPSVMKINTAVSSIRYGMPSLDVIYNDLVSSLKDIEVGNNKSHKISIMEKFNNEDSHFIELKNISIKYLGAKDFSLKNISLIIPKGSTIAIAGPSGAGKTSLINIILGIILPTEGYLLVNNQDIFSNLSLWQQRIGHISQNIFLLDDSIKRNIAFGLNDEDIREDEVWEALNKAQLRNFVNNLPNKLDTFVGERGIRLSGGQQQRLVIARALYNNPEVLIMDEATSSLDYETEKEIMKSIELLRGQKTIIVVAHRLSTIERADRIVVMKSGEIVEIGDNKGLLKRQGYYYQLYRSQEYLDQKQI